MAKVDPKQLKQDGASTNDVLTWDGSEWGPAAAAGGSSDRVIKDGLTTTGLGDGDFGYISAANTVTKTDADNSAAIQVVGANEGVVGSMTIGGIVDAAKFVTDDGAPSNGDPVYLSRNSNDTNSGAGKLTSVAPTGVGEFVVEVGTCIDNGNYAGAKTCVIKFDPKPAIELS